MTELGESADPRALVPGDPQGVDELQARMSRLGTALLEAGDGLSRIDTSGWEGEAADAFRSVFDGVPAQWRGSGEAFADAADALADHGGVLAWAQDEATIAAREWGQAVAVTASAQGDHDRLVADEAARAAAEERPPVALPFDDPGEAGRQAAQERLKRARVEVATSGTRTESIVGRTRDLAPPSPSIATRVASVVGDFASGAWQEISETGQFLWQVNPTRFLVEPAEAVQGWKDLGEGLITAAAHPQQVLEGMLDPREMATNPTRFVGESTAGMGLAALDGVGVAKRIRGAAEAGRIAEALQGGHDGSTPSSFKPGTWGGKTAAEHVSDAGASIGRPGTGKKNKLPTREVDTSAEVDDLYRTLSAGGQVVRKDGAREVTLLPDGTYLTYRPQAKSTPDGAALDIRDGNRKTIKVHVPVVEQK